MLGHFDGLTSLQFIHSDEFKAILSDYFEWLKLEETPEKGERRTSDDFVFVAEEVFRESVSDCEPAVLSGVKIFRIALLEFWLAQSIYNFDIALQLVKLYQELNMNSLFEEKLRYLELKGIQLEALGYVAIKQLMMNNDYGALAFWYSKYFTFLKRNAKDIMNLKARSMLGTASALETGKSDSWPRRAPELRKMNRVLQVWRVSWKVPIRAAR